MSTIDELRAEVERRRAAVQEARAAEREAEQALLLERFRDWDRYEEGDVILVPRNLFGKRVMWPARIWGVHLNYQEGTYSDRHEADPGGTWANQSISYTVFLLDKDTMEVNEAMSSMGVHHRDVQPFEAAAAR